jgi:hypothetical protein
MGRGNVTVFLYARRGSPTKKVEKHCCVTSKVTNLGGQFHKYDEKCHHKTGCSTPWVVMGRATMIRK